MHELTITETGPDGPLEITSSCSCGRHRTFLREGQYDTRDSLRRMTGQFHLAHLHQQAWTVR